MTPETMLQILHEEGISAGADFNNSENVLGWFGWRIDGEYLTVVYQRESDGREFTNRWHLAMLNPQKDPASVTSARIEAGPQRSGRRRVGFGPFEAIALHEQEGEPCGEKLSLSSQLW